MSRRKHLQPTLLDFKRAQVTRERASKGDLQVIADGPNEVRKARARRADPLDALKLTRDQRAVADEWRRLHHSSGFAAWQRSPDDSRIRTPGPAQPGSGPTSPQYLEACDAVRAALGEQGEAIARAVVLEGYTCRELARVHGKTDARGAPLARYVMALGQTVKRSLKALDFLLDKPE